MQRSKRVLGSRAMADQRLGGGNLSQRDMIGAPCGLDGGDAACTRAQDHLQREETNHQPSTKPSFLLESSSDLPSHTLPILACANGHILSDPSRKATRFPLTLPGHRSKTIPPSSPPPIQRDRSSHIVGPNRQPCPLEPWIGTGRVKQRSLLLSIKSTNHGSRGDDLRSCPHGRHDAQSKARRRLNNVPSRRVLKSASEGNQARRQQCSPIKTAEFLVPRTSTTSQASTPSRYPQNGEIFTSTKQADAECSRHPGFEDIHYQIYIVIAAVVIFGDGGSGGGGGRFNASSRRPGGL